MKYGVLFGLQGLLLFGAALYFGSWALMCLWPSCSFLWVSLAYVLQCPSLLGKMPSGRISVVHRLLLFPFHLLTLLTWHLLIGLQREPTYHLIHPTLVVGRRLLPGELSHPVDLIIDLTSEFSQPPEIVRAHGYASIPTLDATEVSLPPLIKAFEQALAQDQRVYIHCAQGHGRTAFAAALLLGMQQRASSPEQALHILKSVRPAMGLNSSQMLALKEAWSIISSSS